MTQVTTMRSKGGVKPAIPTLADPVEKLEGLGGKTRRNLLDVRRCVQNIDARASVPYHAPNEIITGTVWRNRTTCYTLEDALRLFKHCTLICGEVSNGLADNASVLKDVYVATELKYGSWCQGFSGAGSELSPLLARHLMSSEGLAISAMSQLRPIQTLCLS